MITFPWWLALVLSFPVGAFLIWVGYRLGSAERRVDRILAEEKRRPVVKPQEEADQAERAGGS